MGPDCQGIKQSMSQFMATYRARFNKEAPVKEQTHDLAVQAAKAAPAVAGTWWATATPNEQVSLVLGVIVAIYTVIQAAYLIRKWIREEKAFKLKRKGGKATQDTIGEPHETTV